MNQALETLKAYWGYDQFRPLQEEIIQSTLSGKDTLALLPTGGGKSICFQVPGLINQGLTLVISPLIALMKDQVENLNRRGIAATYINSGMSYREIDQKLQGAMDGVYKFLYLAPERIQSDMFRARLPQMKVDLLVVDEAHCISQWGYDFRPAYLRIAEIRQTLARVPLIALTASAPPEVKKDILDKLEMKKAEIFIQSFRRENLRYFVFEEENVARRLLNICQRTQGTGIIYARSRKLTEALAMMLEKEGISARAYHGGMKNSQRADVQQAWLEDRLRIMVATNAFGMGIDKADVRFVVHYNLPFDLESYYQEAGRGGRDGKTALAIAFESAPDLGELQRWSDNKYPDWKTLKSHYALICNYFRLSREGISDKTLDFDMKELSAYAEQPALSLYSSLRVLHNEGILNLNEDSDDFSYIHIIAQPQDVLIYKKQHPRSARVLDFMLRNLGGETYTREVRFLLDNWGRQLDLPPLDLHHLLLRFMQHNLLIYSPASDKPSIRFLKPRHNLSKQELNWDKYTFLQKQNAYRLDQMKHYVQQKEVCRSLVIQQYFGEKDHQTCGKCDICIGRKKTKVDDNEFASIKKALLQKLGEQSLSYRTILVETKSGAPAQREKVLRYLMDKGVILIDEEGILSLSRK
ncbi:MAG: ATP-dependent DNA helicase RecQ [Bacteroidota bacterium]